MNEPKLKPKRRARKYRVLKMDVSKDLTKAKQEISNMGHLNIGNIFCCSIKEIYCIVNFKSTAIILV